MSVEYFLIDYILGNFFTKPTQGSIFRKFRKFILNLWTDGLYRYNTKRSQKCVGFTDSKYK